MGRQTALSGHGVLHRWRTILVIVVIHTSIKICWSLVFMWAIVLAAVSCVCLLIGSCTYIGEASDSVIDVARGILVQLLVMTEDYHSNVNRTQNGELVGLLEKTSFALKEGSAYIELAE